MFSLAGVPPLVGFFGKYAGPLGGVEAGMAWLAIPRASSLRSSGPITYLRIVYLDVFRRRIARGWMGRMGRDSNMPG